MPFYEYQCRQCGIETEVMQKISDRPLKKCPECGKNALVRLISAPVFRLKGGGWYETDFKSDQDRKRNLAESAGDTAAESGNKDSADKSGSDKSTETAGASAKPAESTASGSSDTTAKPSAKPVTKEKTSASAASSAGSKARRKTTGRKPVARSSAAP